MDAGGQTLAAISAISRCGRSNFLPTSKNRPVPPRPTNLFLPISDHEEHLLLLSPIYTSTRRGATSANDLNVVHKKMMILQACLDKNDL